jgi:hypothetical protein
MGKGRNHTQRRKVNHQETERVSIHQNNRTGHQTTNHQKTEVESTTKTSCISNIPQTMDNVQCSVPIMSQPLSQMFRES